MVDQVAMLDNVDFYSLQATIPLTLGLCLNNAGGGIAAGIANLDIYTVTCMVGIFSIVFFAGGYFGGKAARAAASRVNINTSYVSLAVGILLVVLGAEQLADW